MTHFVRLCRFESYAAGAVRVRQQISPLRGFAAPVEMTDVGGDSAARGEMTRVVEGWHLRYPTLPPLALIRIQDGGTRDSCFTRPGLASDAVAM